MRLLALGAAVLTAGACSSLLDVDNPNAVAEDALGNPAASQAISNGIYASTVRMLSGITTPYAVATDELDWIGSRDAWFDLETGAISNYLNEFTDQAFPWVGEARYIGDDGIVRLEAFNAAGTIGSRVHLVRAYLHTAVVYASIADMYDDFAFSSKTIGKAPIGRANMGTLYDKAVEYLDKANAIVTAPGASAEVASLRYPVLANRARIKHAKAVWQKITPKGSTVPASPLVSDAGANADAAAAIALGSADEEVLFACTVDACSNTIAITIWFEVNGRNEHRVGAVYGSCDANTDLCSGSLIDPVSGAADPTAQRLLQEFFNFGTQSGDFTITSTRELRLILAEAELATAGVATPAFTAHINAVRSLDGKPNWTVNPNAQAILIHERQAQLWLMRRRLADMHRFGLKDAGAAVDGQPRWRTNTNFESTFNVIGLLFPIPNVERLGNPCIETPTGAGCQ